MAKKRCANCGAVIGDDAAFCIFCGTQVESENPSNPGHSQTGPTGSIPAAQWAATPQEAPQPQRILAYSAQAAPQRQAHAQQNSTSKLPIGAFIGIAAAVVVILVFVVACVAVPAFNGSSSISKSATSVSSPSNSASTSGNMLPRFTSAEVSSQLPGDEDTADYGALNLIDGKADTAWNEGAAGTGIGEWIKFSASDPQRVTSVSIMGGFPKLYKDGTDVYQKNPRPREITISYEGGSQKFTMQDVREQFQTFTLSKPVDTKWITITIDSVYPGTKYEDCCIAEVKFQ